MQFTKKLHIYILLLSMCGLILFTPSQAQDKKSLTFVDVMKFRAIQDPVLSSDGSWIAYSAEPDRGDGQVYVQSANGESTYTLDNGSDPVFTKNTKWLAATVNPSFVELEKAKTKKSKDASPKKGLALLNVGTGEWQNFNEVEKFVFSDDSQWLAYLKFKEDEKNDEETAEKEEGAEKKEVPIGKNLILLDLNSGTSINISYVDLFDFASDSRYLAYSTQNPQGAENGLFYRALGSNPSEAVEIVKADEGRYTNLVWSKENSNLAFLAAGPEEKGKDDAAVLWIWDGSTKQAKEAVKEVSSGWIVPLKNQISWTKDATRLFFGQRPAKEEEPILAGKGSKAEEEIDIYDLDAIVEGREGDIWHWNDPRIATHQKQVWPQIKDSTYLAVYDVSSGTSTALADESIPQARSVENPRRTIGTSDIPYMKERTWDGTYNDIYIIDLRDGSQKKVTTRLSGRPSLSLGGQYIAFYENKHWFLYDCNSGTTRNLTKDLAVPFYDEDHDYPSDVPGYGLGGWVGDDESVLIYDKFDIWQIGTSGGSALNLTEGEGRKAERVFRIISTDPDKERWETDEMLLLSGYHDKEKNYGFYSSQIGRGGTKMLKEEKKRFRFLSKAENADVFMYTRESYSEFPDIWVSDSAFQAPRKISDVNPQISEFAWGEPELVEWHSIDGKPLQGILIKPGNYEPGKRYPVIVYFYRFFSQRMYEFNQPVVNHRPCFPYYTSNGYAIFLPDIRFEVGRPGFASTKCLVPGVQKLIDMGIADPDAVGLHGHSWSGYQTAFMITQTDIFAVAIAGAPVSNMTSAYSGIRWQTGLARQFQYEKTQSRIGGTLWDSLPLYIENSPVFYADRINTPLLIQFGDEDGAVPWYQGIELYLAMRRLEKDCIFLQYHGEPHHLQKYPNKLDYAIKMREYFDHYLKGKEAADWIKKGAPYRGK